MSSRSSSFSIGAAPSRHGISAMRPVACARRCRATVEPRKTTDWCATSARCMPRSRMTSFHFQPGFDVIVACRPGSSRRRRPGPRPRAPRSRTTRGLRGRRRRCRSSPSAGCRHDRAARHSSSDEQALGARVLLGVERYDERLDTPHLLVEFERPVVLLRAPGRRTSGSRPTASSAPSHRTVAHARGPDAATLGHELSRSTGLARLRRTPALRALVRETRLHATT